MEEKDDLKIGNKIKVGSADLKIIRFGNGRLHPATRVTLQDDQNGRIFHCNANDIKNGRLHFKSEAPEQIKDETS